jgi:hypothetical protein
MHLYGILYGCLTGEIPVQVGLDQGLVVSPYLFDFIDQTIMISMI